VTIAQVFSFCSTPDYRDPQRTIQRSELKLPVSRSERDSGVAEPGELERGIFLSMAVAYSGNAQVLLRVREVEPREDHDTEQMGFR
jgi:hypothetical protein